jgi:transposase
MESSMQNKEKFATQVASEILSEIRAIAHAEGRQLQALVEEALADLIEKRHNTHPRDHVMRAYRASQDKYGELYRMLAR